VTTAGIMLARREPAGPGKTLSRGPSVEKMFEIFNGAF